MASSKNKKQTITIISWNVNGLRAIIRKEAFQELLKLDVDILCLQETKSEREQVPEEFLEPSGYVSDFWSSQVRKGHAGVATYYKSSQSSKSKEVEKKNATPDLFADIKEKYQAKNKKAQSSEGPLSGLEVEEVLYGFSGKDKKLDIQGRVITHIFKNGLAVMNAYFPQGGSKTSPLEYKKEFYKAMMRHLNRLRKKGLTVVAGGDWNICHTEMDIKRAKENVKSIGFLPEERAILDLFHKKSWIDVWRKRNPELRDVYTWWNVISRARDRNIGWRIDTFYIDESNLPKVVRMEVLTDFMGSDHCPILIEVEI